MASETEAERRRLLVDLNRTETSYPRTSCVHDLFEAKARDHAEKYAVTCNHERLTYCALNKRANQVARCLLAKGVVPATRVGLCLDRSLDMVVAILAVLKTGAAYAPLGSRSPADRLSDMLDDLQPPVVLTHERFRQRLLTALSHAPRAAAARIICLDKDQQEIGRQLLSNLDIKSRSDALAYISFTSGSTGRPKGVCVPHRGIVRLVRNTNYATFGPEEVFLQNAPISFDASLFEIWGSLLNGAQLVLTPSQLPTLSELAQLVLEHGVTTAWFTTGLFNQLVDENPSALAPLKQVLTGGDIASPFHIRKALKFIRKGDLINGYGPTENSTFSTTYTVPRNYDGVGPVPIGRPIANSLCYILDRNLEPVPVGAPGELFVGGDGLAEGYLNRRQRTAERFIQNPFVRGTRIYRTGDRARYLPDDNIEFLGRIDQQVKIRGFRVEPGDIETKLLQDPSVRQCVVAARSGANGHKQLVAYVVAEHFSEDAKRGWQHLLRRQLPDYMVPAFFVAIDRVPLNANGKVDYQGLPAPERSITRLDNTATPTDGLEDKLQKIWERIFELQPIGKSDHFFSLGGHSLLAMRLVAEIEKNLGETIPVPAVFENPTISQLANVLRGADGRHDSSNLIQLQPHGTRPPLILVHGAGGGMFWGYANLSRCLGTDQPVLTFQSRGLEGLTEAQSIAGLANVYTKELRRFQPRGPYFLGGYCFGGLVAYEIARRLEQTGQAPRFLGLINTSVPNSSYAHVAWSPATAFKFARNLLLKSIYAQAGNRWAELLRWRGRLLRQRFNILTASNETKKFNAEEWADLSSYSEEERELWQTHIRAWTEYEPQSYNGPVTLFRSTVHQIFCSFDESYGWREYAKGGVEVHRLSGGHDTIMKEPYVKGLATVFSAALKRAQAAD